MRAGIVAGMSFRRVSAFSQIGPDQPVILAVMIESVVAYAHEARWQYMLEEAAQELLFIQRAGFVLFGGAVGVAEADLSVPMPEDATLADSRLVNVTCEVSQGHTRVAHGLELHRPGLPPNLFWN